MTLAWTLIGIVYFLCDPVLAIISRGTAQNAKAYQRETPTYDNATGDSLALHLSGPHTRQWYLDQCTSVKMRCEAKIEEVENTWDISIRRLEDEYKSLAKVACGAQQTVDYAQESVERQETTLTTYEDRIEVITAKYEATKMCPDQLSRAEEELEALESEPDVSEDDLRAECLKKKEVLELKKCVKKFIAARTALSKTRLTYTSMQKVLSEKKATVESSSEGVESYEQRAEEARRLLEEARAKGFAEHTRRIETRCEREMVSLKQMVDDEISAAASEYNKKVEIYGRSEDKYEEKRTVVEQQTEQVTTEKLHVDEALRQYNKFKHCPAQMEKAEEELRRLRAIPNESEDDIDDECYKKADIMKLRRCVDKFYEARDVLTRARAIYEEEARELGTYEKTVETSITSVRRYQRLVERFESSWKSAQSSRKALITCAGGMLQQGTDAGEFEKTDNVIPGAIAPGRGEEMTVERKPVHQTPGQDHGAATGFRLATLIPLAAGIAVFLHM